jgi:phosphate transport system protein
MAKHLQKQIDGLKQKVLFLGALVEEAIAKAISALVHRDRNLARAVIDDDEEIDRMEVEVEEEVLKILALYQPVAVDLRFVVAVLKINSDLERMGDLARKIAKRVLFLTSGDRIELPGDFRGIASRAQWMVKASLDALVNADANLARQVRESDERVNALRREIDERIEKQILAHPDQSESYFNLAGVSRHLERLADMACSVAEDVIYMVEGSIVRHSRAQESSNPLSG